MTEVNTAKPANNNIVLKKALQKAGLKKLSKDILSKCAALASTLHVEPEQLADVWEAFSVSKDVTELTEDTFTAFRTEVYKTANTTAVQTRPVKREISTPDGKTSTQDDSAANANANANAVVVTPMAKRQRTEGATTTPSSTTDPTSLPTTVPSRTMSKYEDRKKAGQIAATYQPDGLKPDESSRTENVRCVINTKEFETNVQSSYRHMFTTIADRANALEEHLKTMGDTIVKTFDVRTKQEMQEDGEQAASTDIAPLEALNIPKHDKITCVGRICNEVHQGRMNKTTVVLEGSRTAHGGARVKVDLSQMNESKTPFHLFPGQIVAVEGMNPTGQNLVAHRICEGAPPTKPSSSSVRTLRNYHHDSDHQDGKPVRVMTACGPFTTSDNMDYKPFTDLIYNIIDDAPDVVLLAGPFVDMRQPTVQSGDVKADTVDEKLLVAPFETVFANKIIATIEELMEVKPELKTEFVLVPSLDDASAKWVFPQPPLADRLEKKIANRKMNSPFLNTYGVRFGSMGLKNERIHCVSNPCTFRINEVVFGITSSDVMFHMNIEDVSGNLVPGTKQKRLAQHIIQQQNYYPLFPPSEKFPINLDLKKMNQWKLPCQPDVLILPSRLAPFAAPVLQETKNATVVINPGFLARGTTGGTYATMDIHPIARETLENTNDDVQLPHAISERIHVNVKYI